MVGAEGMPVVIGFGSCQPFGKRLLTLGTEGWIDSVAMFSKREHDVFALKKIREWFREPWFCVRRLLADAWMFRLGRGGWHDFLSGEALRAC